jgi:predicted RNase H-like HicB family nuclease
MSATDLKSEVFNARQACAITGITSRQVTHWDARGVVKPSVCPASGRGSRRLYSYIDLLVLRTVRSLREQGVSLQKVRKCIQYLRRRFPDVSMPLDFCTLITDGTEVYLIEDESTLIATVKRQGQRAFLQLSIAALDRELRGRVLKLVTERVEEVVVGDYAYQVQIELDKDSGGYVAEVAGLPGCITQGDTLEEVREMVRDAIVTYLEAVEDLKKRHVNLPVHRRHRQRTRVSA